VLNGLKSWLKPETKALTLDEIAARVVNQPTAAGVSVTTENFWKHTPARVAVQVIAETIAQLPLHLYRRLPDGGRERAVDHPLHELLTGAANPWMPASEWRLVMGTSFATHGNAFAFANRVGDRIAELIPLAAKTVTVETAEWEPVYRVRQKDGTDRTYTRSEIIHICGAGRDLYKGNSPVEDGREAIALGAVLEQHGAKLFGAGAKPSGILKYGKQLNDSLMARLRASFNGVYAGGENAGKTLILENGIEFQPLTLNSVDAQYLELRKHQVEEVLRLWRMPPHLAGDMSRATWGNTETMGQQFLTFCLMPILRLFCDAIAITCLSEDERKELYCEFLIDDIARANLSERMQAFATAISHSILSPDECRSMMGRGSIPDGSGAVFTRPVNAAPVATEAAR